MLFAHAFDWIGFESAQGPCRIHASSSNKLSVKLPPNIPAANFWSLTLHRRRERVRLRQRPAIRIGRLTRQAGSAGVHVQLEQRGPPRFISISTPSRMAYAKKAPVSQKCLASGGDNHYLAVAQFRTCERPCRDRWASGQRPDSRARATGVLTAEPWPGPPVKYPAADNVFDCEPRSAPRLSSLRNGQTHAIRN